MTLGDVIKSYRDENKVSMEYVANLCGITKGYVAMLEKNVNPKTGRPVKPTIETIVKVCNGLHLDFNSVFDSLDDDYEINISTSQPSSSAPELELTEQQEELIKLSNNLSEEQVARILSYAQAIYDLQSDDQHPAVSISKAGEKNAAEEAEREVNRIVAKELAAAKKSIAK